jgi:general secretion pathway protein E
MNRLPYHYAQQQGVFIRPEDAPFTVVMREDAPLSALLEMRRTLGPELSIETLPVEAYGDALTAQYQTGATEAAEAAAGYADVLESVQTSKDLLAEEDDAPIIKLINALLSEAIALDASDIHVETFEQRVQVRFRVDGQLRDSVAPQRSLALLLVSRIKVMAKLDIAEKRIPQDGRITVQLGQRAIDIRVSTLPTRHGERVVLRLLDRTAMQLSLTHLGMSEALMRHFQAALEQPYGIILVTGPTGSGKTTSLYASLAALNDGRRNILTVEDPVEYELDGIGQTQVNDKAGMSFAKGLRAILRQDPDVVMIGEIRDKETADIAVQASLTGHLVLSTLHTNTAAGAISRLRDMGVEPFLLASSLTALVAQRLVRVLCECKTPIPLTPDIAALFGVDADTTSTIYRANGCEHCNGLGYRGRTGIYEMIRIDEPIRQLIHQTAPDSAINAHARQTLPAIRQDGWRLVLAGITTPDEVLRVTAME